MVVQDGQKGAREAVVSKMKHEDAGCAKMGMKDSAQLDGPRIIETAQDRLLELIARNLKMRM